MTRSYFKLIVIAALSLSMLFLSGCHAPKDLLKNCSTQGVRVFVLSDVDANNLSFDNVKILDALGFGVEVGAFVLGNQGYGTLSSDSYRSRRQHRNIGSERGRIRQACPYGGRTPEEKRHFQHHHDLGVVQPSCGGQRHRLGPRQKPPRGSLCLYHRQIQSL